MSYAFIFSESRSNVYHDACVKRVSNGTESLIMMSQSLLDEASEFDLRVYCTNKAASEARLYVFIL